MRTLIPLSAVTAVLNTLLCCSNGESTLNGDRHYDYGDTFVVHGDAAQGDPAVAGDQDGSGDEHTLLTPCNNDDECRSGLCVGGFCAPATACTDHAQCRAGEYCHFPSVYPWEDTTEGACSGPCTNDASCAIIGQECINGRCYTNIDCNESCGDCPSGEVCSDSHFCSAPHNPCYFDQHCPCDWLCGIDGVCFDPHVIPGECSVDADCNPPDPKPGCELGNCECFDRLCRIAASCDPTQDDVAQCGSGNYCAESVCQPARSCPNGEDDCVVFGLVCESGYCVNPDPCSQPGDVCPGGFACNTHRNVCLPLGTRDCFTDRGCPSGTFCQTVTGECVAGCRDNFDCANNCPGAAWCTCAGDVPCPNCNSAHRCTDAPAQLTNCDRVDADTCPEGTVCGPPDPTCITGCPPDECLTACDQLYTEFFDQCGVNTCETPGAWFAAVLQVIAGTDVGLPTAGVCYPP